MKTFAPMLGLSLLVLATAVAPCRAAPADNISYVDPEAGNDLGNADCAASGPCATLKQGLANLPATGGTVIIESGGVFPPIFINTAVTIIGPADHSAIIDWQANTGAQCVDNKICLATALYAVDVQAGAASNVRLENIVIDNNGGANGALHLGSAEAVVLNDVIMGDSGSTAGAPQLMLVDVSQGAPMEIVMHDCDVGFNANGGGMLLFPGNAYIMMSIDHSEVHNAIFGLQIINASPIQVVIDQSHFFSFNNSAFSVGVPYEFGSTTVSLNRSTISNTGGAALRVNGASSTATLYGSIISGNASGVNVLNGASVFSYENSSIISNGFNCAVNGAPTDCTSVLNAQSAF
jgi:hypothetical protein